MRYQTTDNMKFEKKVFVVKGKYLYLYRYKNSISYSTFFFFPFFFFPGTITTTPLFTQPPHVSKPLPRFEAYRMLCMCCPEEVNMILWKHTQIFQKHWYGMWHVVGRGRWRKTLKLYFFSPFLLLLFLSFSYSSHHRQFLTLCFWLIACLRASVTLLSGHHLSGKWVSYRSMSGQSEREREKVTIIAMESSRKQASKQVADAMHRGCTSTMLALQSKYS